MKRLFLLTPDAKSDLSEILLGIAEKSPAAAERLRLEIYQSFKRLGESPASATITNIFSTGDIASRPVGVAED